MIDRVKMLNWRAYEKYEIQFEPGITFIMGANGIGKTSVLEAIAYALTGEPATVKDRGKLLRDPGRLATVTLTFSVDSQQYVVERSQSRTRADRATLTRLQDRKQLASSHKGVTEAIEDLMGVSSDFLRRIIYMAEGDVFRFLDHPPGDALDLQIRQVLGLTHLDQFVKALELATKEIKERIGAIQDLLGDLDRLGAGQDSGFQQRPIDFDRRREEELLASYVSIQKQISEQRRESEDLRRLSSLVEAAAITLKQDADLWHRAQQVSVPHLYQELETLAEGTRSRLREAEVALARLEGQQSSRRQALDLILSYETSTETLPCPVCGKPMTRAEREIVAGQIDSDIGHISGDMAETTKRRREAEAAFRCLQGQVDNLRELRNALVHHHPKSLRPDATLPEVVRATRNQEIELPSPLEEQARQLQQHMTVLQAERSEYVALQQRLRSLGFSTPEEARDALVDLEIRSLSLRAAQRAAQETLTAQRNVDMVAIYDKISRVWGAFRGGDDWHIELDSSGMPQMEDNEGRRLDLSQFSGGEKTALLIMLHTIIAYHFSRSDFLLVDEPLEHLDPVNRRSLIHFLVGAYRRGAFRQALVATFEESLIRKYMSEEGVHVVHL